MRSPADTLAAARARLDASLELLAALVETNTHADNVDGIAQAHALLEPHLVGLGFRVERVRSGPRTHLVARRERGGPAVLLMGHLDTVFPRDHAFQRLTRGGDTWRGPGVSDMKGGIVTALLALALMPLDEASFRLVLASDEEIGSPTALPVIQDAAQGIDLALCFEAARPCGGLVIARKGYGSARVAVEGRGGHAGIAHDTSVNAFTALARVVLAAEALEQDGVTVSPGGAVRVAPAAVNAIPERAECELEWRFETAASGEATLRALRAIAVEGARVTMDAHIECPPMAVDARSDRVLRCYVEAARGLGMDVRGVATAGVGDINHVAHLGAACLDGVGPEGGGFHTEDEHVVVDSIARRAAMTATALPRYLSELRAR